MSAIQREGSMYELRSSMTGEARVVRLILREVDDYPEPVFVDMDNGTLYEINGSTASIVGSFKNWHGGKWHAKIYSKRPTIFGKSIPVGTADPMGRSE